jgi:hypothetical protein
MIENRVLDRRRKKAAGVKGVEFTYLDEFFIGMRMIK